jgi:hypothetical protein
MRPWTGMIAAALWLVATVPSAWAQHDAKDAHAATTTKPVPSTAKATTVNPSTAAGAKPAAAANTKASATAKVAAPGPQTSAPAKVVAPVHPSTSAKSAAPGVQASAPPKAAAPNAQTNSPAKTPAPKGKPAPVQASGVNSLAKSSSSRPAAKGGASAIVESSAHLDEQVTYQYNALGRRDPFQSLLTGEYVGADVGGDAPPDVGGLKVVGIVWGDADQFALVEDVRGDSHLLRRGDKVMNGFVEALKRDAMVVNLTVDGQSQSVTIPLTRKGEKTNANR